MPTETTTAELTAINSSLQNIAYTLQHQSFWNSPLFAAIVGAVAGALLGLLPFLWLLYKDRPIIKVKAQIDWFVSAANTHPRKVLSIKIYNSGRRAANITSIYLRFASGESLVFLTDAAFIGGYPLPFKLEENSSRSVSIVAGSIAQTVLEKQVYPVAACYSDALGNVYQHKLASDFWERFFKDGHPEKEGRF